MQWQRLHAHDPAAYSRDSLDIGQYTEDDIALLNEAGPKHQIGTGCSSDALVGIWLAEISGIGDLMSEEVVRAHLDSLFKYNYFADIDEQPNPARAGYALAGEAGLILCSWPDDNAPALPFQYSAAVWPGVEYTVAALVMMHGMVDEGLALVRAVRARYDGQWRNPFDESNAAIGRRDRASYALINTLTGLRYDAVDRTLYINSRIGDFWAFLSTNTGYGTVIF